MEKVEKFLDKYSFLFIVLLAIPAFWALLVPGFFGASDDLHIAWLYEMDRALKSGQFPPRFVPDLSYGFGYPLFNFVFPLPFYIGEIFHLIGFNLVDSVKIVFLLSIPLSMYFMYKLIRAFSTPLLSLAGALIYGYTPYRSTDIYVRGAFGEALSFVFLPILALSFIKIVLSDNKKESLFWLGSGGLSLASLILCHDITAYMFFPVCLFLVVLFLFIVTDKRATFLNLSGLIGLGLLSSLYFWLPAILESSLMKYDTVFDFVDHFPTLQQLFIPFWGYGASVPGPHDGISFFIGTFNLLIFILGFILLFIFWRKYSLLQRVVLSWSVVVFIIALVMMNFRSIPIWSHLPLIAYFQFPWRFLILTTFSAPLLVITLSRFKANKYFGLVLVILIVIFNWSFFRPHDFLGREDSYYLNRYIPYPAASSDYQLTQEEYLRLPINTQTRPNMVYPRVFPLNQNIQNVNTLNSLDTVIKTSASSSFTLNYNKYLFPGWGAKIDNKPVAIKSGVPFGQISIDVPSGMHKIEIYYSEPIYKRMLDIISLASVMVCIYLILQFKFLSKKG